MYHEKQANLNVATSPAEKAAHRLKTRRHPYQTKTKNKKWD